MDNKINICLVADNNYIMPTTISINSIYLNRNNNYIYNIYIIINNGLDDNIKILNELNDNNFNINIIKIDKTNELFKFNINEISATPTSIMKFYIPEILNNIDKVLYIDGDIIVKNDLYELYNIDIKDNYIGAVKDTCGLSKSLYRLFKKGAFYFNSGVMLMNLKIMRENKTSEKLMDYRINGYNQLMDQDALNYVFKNKVLRLPFIYNTQLCCFDDVKRFSYDKQMEVLKEYFNLDYKVDKNNIIDNAIILHYSGSLKPWHQGSTIESDLWDYYYKNSPYKNITLNKKAKNIKKINCFKKIIKRIRRLIFMHNFM